MKVGDEVEKTKGYRWPGVIVASFTTLSGEHRVVVECTAPAVAGALHIYAPEQIAVTRPAKTLSAEQRYRQAILKARLISRRQLRRFLAGDEEVVECSMDLERKFLIAEIARLQNGADHD